MSSTTVERCSRLLAVAASSLCWSLTTAWSSSGADVQARLDADIAASKPIVVHVVVALCDNANQGIVPVPRELGNGQDPRSNLYWGALYGLRTHLPHAAGWGRLDAGKPEDARILDRVVMTAKLQRGETSATVFVVADAWDGKHIKGALETYLGMAAGRSPEIVDLKRGERQIELPAGGSAHLVAYVGHNGLMEFSLDARTPASRETPARSAIVLACASKPYFLDHLRRAQAHPLLLTTGLMAPEAYTLDAAIRSWVEESSTSAVVRAAARAYDRYQECGVGAAERLFWGAP